jgi:regulator of replication initiation timing
VADQICQKQVNLIVSMTSDLAMERNQMVTIEEQIKDFMIENAVRRTEREKLIELLPEMVKTGQAGKPTQDLIKIFNSLEQNTNKEKLT